jgi:hypothetical protein
MLFLHCNGVTPRTGGASQIAYSMGVLGRDYQGCVAVGKDGTFFQSRSRCSAWTEGGVLNAIEGTIKANGDVDMEGTDGPGVGGIGWIGFGRPLAKTAWHPHIYRRVDA